MPSSEYSVNIAIKTTDQTSGPAKQAAKGLSLLDGVMVGLGNAALGMARQLPAAAVELVKLGATAERQGNSLNSLAAAAGTSGDQIIKAIQGASQYTISQMDAMAAANRAMVMDVAQSPQEFERLTKVAVALGRAMGQDATKSIDDFVTASARQSQMIADNLGLTVTVGQATERYAEQLGVTVDELTDAEKKQAFLNMMLDEGEKKMAALGDATLDNAGKIEQATSLWKTFTATVGKGFSEAILGSTGELGKLNQFLDENQTVLSKAVSLSLQLVSGQKNAAQVLSEVTSATEAGTEAAVAAARGHMLLSGAIDSEARAHELLRGAVDSSAREQAVLDQITKDSTSSVAYYAAVNGTMQRSVSVSVDSWNQYSDAIASSERAQDDAAASALELGKAEGLAAQAAADAAAKRLGLSISWTSQLDSMKESSEQFAADRESLDAQHQARLAEIAKKGQSRSIQINVEAEQKKLGELQYRMEQAQLKVEEMTGKEAESTRIGKEHTLSEAQTAYAQQQKLLEDYSASRLVTAGQNTDAMIAEEQRKYDESVRLMDLQMEKQAQVQKQALGQMMLQSFDAWSEGKDVPVEKMIEMRTSIAEQYGLVGAGATDLVTDTVGEWDRWAADTKISTDDVVRYMSNVIDATGNVDRELVDLTAKEWNIRVRYELLYPEGLDPKRAPRPTGDAQGVSAQGISAPTVSGIGAPATVHAPVTNTETYHETYNILDPRAMAVIQENQRRQRRASLSRYM